MHGMYGGALSGLQQWQLSDMFYGDSGLYGLYAVGTGRNVYGLRRRVRAERRNLYALSGGKLCHGGIDILHALRGGNIRGLQRCQRMLGLSAGTDLRNGSFRLLELSCGLLGLLGRSLLGLRQQLCIAS